MSVLPVVRLGGVKHSRFRGEILAGVRIFPFPRPPVTGDMSEEHPTTTNPSPPVPEPPDLAARPARGSQPGNGADGGPKSERTRQRILDAAARTFRDKGFAGTTLNDIAVAARLRAGASTTTSTRRNGSSKRSWTSASRGWRRR